MERTPRDLPVVFPSFPPIPPPVPISQPTPTGFTEVSSFLGPYKFFFFFWVPSLPSFFHCCTLSQVLLSFPLSGLFFVPLVNFLGITILQEVPLVCRPSGEKRSLRICVLLPPDSPSFLSHSPLLFPIGDYSRKASSPLRDPLFRHFY